MSTDLLGLGLFLSMQHMKFVNECSLLFVIQHCGLLKQVILFLWQIKNASVTVDWPIYLLEPNRKVMCILVVFVKEQSLSDIFAANTPKWQQMLPRLWLDIFCGNLLSNVHIVNNCVVLCYLFVYDWIQIQKSTFDYRSMQNAV